ncbi:unnamed protein product, partial [marine sediment metagenome]
MKQLKHILFIALKDLKLFATDRMALSFFIIFPFLFVVIFNFMMGDVGSEDERLELHLATQEAEGGLSHQIIGAIETRDDSQLKPGEPKIVWLKDYDQAHQAVEDKEIAGFLAFPSDFTEGVMMGSGAQLEVAADAEAINTRAALYGLARAIASGVGSQYVAANATIELLIEQGLITPGDTAEIEQVIQQRANS